MTARAGLTDLDRSETHRRTAERLEGRARKETNPAKANDLYNRAADHYRTAEILRDRYFG